MTSPKRASCQTTIKLPAESDIRPVAVMLALSLLIALVLTMIERRRLLLPGCVIERRQCIEPIAGAGLQPRPHRPRRALHHARHAMRRHLGLVAHPLPHLLPPPPARA